MDGVERIMVLGIFAVIVSILAVAAWSVSQDDLALGGVADGGASTGAGAALDSASARGENAAPLGTRASADELLARFEASKAERQKSQSRRLVRPEPKPAEKAAKSGINTSKPSNPYSNGSSLANVENGGAGRVPGSGRPRNGASPLSGGAVRPGDAALALKANGSRNAATGQQPVSARKVIVKEGDTLWSLVRRGVAGDAPMSEKVAFTAKFNNVSAGDLKAGQTLMMPFKVHADSPPAQPLPVLKAAATGGKGPDASLSSATLYTVVEGDSLSSIAKRLLGKASRYQEIFELNEDRLASASEIRVGMTLRVPAQ